MSTLKDGIYYNEKSLIMFEMFVYQYVDLVMITGPINFVHVNKKEARQFITDYNLKFIGEL